jgi:hypothetical protein
MSKYKICRDYEAYVLDVCDIEEELLTRVVVNDYDEKFQINFCEGVPQLEKELKDELLNQIYEYLWGG